MWKQMFLGLWIFLLQVVVTSQTQPCPVCVCPVITATDTVNSVTTTPLVKTTTPLVKTTTTPVVKTTTMRTKQPWTDVSIAHKLRKLKQLKQTIARHIQHYRTKARQSMRKANRKNKSWKND